MNPRERVEKVALLKPVARGLTTIIIDHDMDSLFELVERVTVLQEMTRRCGAASRKPGQAQQERSDVRTAFYLVESRGPAGCAVASFRCLALPEEAIYRTKAWL
ncbi:hypothetical protein FJ950_08735 [Mesorhizobium sp. B2-3-14]|uniref:hypothetical protein n=1 Tax=unclassified Mesorhizobium TaxID=325217 RepID=UPI00112CA060|nr:MULTISPECIES: hypothetical protein [unclassified Mesorhizobium]TPK72376.1 hypothetical protein FJ527_25395 [Mesorhizobium sp. B2-4-18]TPL88137.1 hypothetical protein FJ950_08735 [Mesorhizobium sp. B2-3-14]